MPNTEDQTRFEKLKEEVNVAIPQCIEATLGKVTAYHSKQVDEWSESIGQSVLVKLQELNCNFKYIVNTSIMEKRGAGLHTSAAVFWDPDIDGSVSYRWENKAMVCVVQAFGIGI
mmetsp:Transcript_96985/g.274056  ORF Transcript_96985/g.274056 Transcript_96985/m.274056 type:complete len:115 (-) Transcript_96985:168-512(-)